MHYYVYIYLDPRNELKYETSYCNFNFEPIYVGIGKNERYKHHINEAFKFKNNKKINKKTNYLKINKLLKIINSCNVSKEYYINNFVKTLYSDISKEDALRIEQNIIDELGTIEKVCGVYKRGPLTNLVKGGNNNPILIGENNPMYNKTVYNIWREQGYDISEIKKRWSENASKRNKEMWSEMNKEKRNNISTKISLSNKGDNHYSKKLGSKEHNKLHKKIQQKRKSTIENWSNEERKLYGSKISKALKSNWKNKSENDKIKHSEKTKNGLKDYFKNKYTVNDSKERSEKRKEFLKNNPEFTEKLRKSNVGKNHYLYGYNNVYEYYEKKYGKEYAENKKLENKERNSGKNNPMYGKGEQMKGSNNGNSKIIIIHFPTGEKYVCNGTWKHFIKNVLKNYKPQPHRKDKEWQNRNNWLIQEINSFNEINKDNYIFYEGTKNQIN